MINKIVFVIGLPGSGKTYFVNSQKDGFVLDDPKNFHQINHAINECNRLNLSILYVTDPHFCDKMVLVAAIKIFKKLLKIDDFDFIYFENDPEQCLINAKNRNDGRKVDGMIKYLSKIYQPIKPIPVYKGV